MILGGNLFKFRTHPKDRDLFYNNVGVKCRTLIWSEIVVDDDDDCLKPQLNVTGW